ncbi:putative glycosyltransferase family 28 domain-containing protein [Erysiphe necator]|uniref:Sterol 3-beta-glucosyltransferase n=1 Tax=Uncinula necator TaxID=52586 RepID=A0A0B1P0V8_UNCNE|nr:putative glycosyltransferase family 28 domain-containing protein [Erysiphe necator]
MAVEGVEGLTMSKNYENKKFRIPEKASIPERFQDEDDVEEDCTAPSGTNTYMSQSVFGMLATVGPQIDYTARFHIQSSDDEESEASPQNAEARETRIPDGSHFNKPVKLRKKFSRHKLLCSVSELGSKSTSTPSSSDLNKRSSVRPKKIAPSSSSYLPVRPAMVMSRMLEAQEAMNLRPDSNAPIMDMNVKEKEEHIRNCLSRKLKEIFSLETAEEVIEEYPCCLMNSVLLQGYMYITKKHICFYAYLPKKSNEVVKSGYLYKSGRRNLKFHRYWFRLKGDVLSYYNDPSDLYFLRGNIDLRYGISATVASKENSKDAVYFNVVTHQREFNFKADSVASAKEWVKVLQKIIFQSHNEGDSVKISLPINNVIDIEEIQIIDFADTCKIRAVDNGDTYAVDEYFFSFFSFGKEALSLLRRVVEDTTAQHIPDEVLGISPNKKSDPGDEISSSKWNCGLSPKGKKPVSNSLPQIPNVPLLEENVRATLTLIENTTPRVSSEINQVSYDGGRRSLDQKSTARSGISPFRLERDVTKNKPKSPNEKIAKLNGEPLNNDNLSRTSCNTSATEGQILKSSETLFPPEIEQESQTISIIENKTDPLSNKTPVISYTRPSNDLAMEPLLDENECSVTTPTLQSIVKASAYPLQKAAGFAGYINKHSRRMSSLLATESIVYAEKVSGMWKGGKKHYGESHGLESEYLYEEGDNEDIISSIERFREHFSLPETEKLHATYFGFLNRVLPLYGKIYISDQSFCFRSLLPGTSTKLILPLIDIENADKENGFRFGYSGLVVVIRGHEELFFEFPQSETRDDCAVTLLQKLDTLRFLRESGQLAIKEEENAQNAVNEHLALQQVRSKRFDLNLSEKLKEKNIESAPITFDDPRASILNFKPNESLRVTCLTIGSRGDVQPYIALCKGLLAEGHQARIATHIEFKDWVESYGIDFKAVSGDPAELMRICIENGMFTYSFLREASSKFRGWIDELLSSAWVACQDSDLLIESPSAMGGIHIAEALEIPYFRAFTMPWTRTRAYPHAFAVPEHKMGGAYNYITYVMFDNIFWKAIAGQVNMWRKKQLGLYSTNLEKMQANKVPFLYNFSPAVVAPPLDYSDWIRVTGYWFLDEGTDWEPSKELTDFIDKAKKDEKKIVYIGFGSIIVQDSVALMTTIIKSVEKADIRCILSRGWSDRLDKKNAKKTEPPLPSSIIQIRSAPHDWLFSRIDAAAHHGGAGTTGASLRAGLPTIVKPFFGDQYFFGSRVEDLGVGIVVKKLNVSLFSRALWQVCNDERMIIKAKILGETIRKENGVDTAIQAIYRDLDYARSLIKRRSRKLTDDVLDDSEESWTFIGEEKDAELVLRLQNWKAKNVNKGNSPFNEREDDSDEGALQKNLIVENSV